MQPVIVRSLSSTPNTYTSSQPVVCGENRSCDLVRLHELGIVDGKGVVQPGFSFSGDLTPKARDNLSTFLTKERSDGHTLMTVLKSIHSYIGGDSLPPRIVGEELKGLLGWEFVSSHLEALVKQKNLRLEECFSPECLQALQEECTQTPRILTIRYLLLPNMQNRQERIVQLFRYLDQYILKGKVLRVNEENVQLSSFCYKSKIAGQEVEGQKEEEKQEQWIHFDFIERQASEYLTTNEAVQLALDEVSNTLKPSILHFNAGNQWCVDVALKRLAIDEPSSKTGKILVRHIQHGYDSSGFQSQIVQEGLHALWLRCNTDFAFTEERAMQNMLTISQLALQAAAERLIAPFIQEACNQATIDAQKSVWHAAVSLLAEQRVTYESLELIVQTLGISAMCLETNGTLSVTSAALLGRKQLRCTSDRYTFQIPLQPIHAVKAFLASFDSIKDHCGFKHLLEALVLNRPRKKQPPLMLPSTDELAQITKLLDVKGEASYILTLLLSNLPSEQELFEMGLRRYTEALQSEDIHFKQMAFELLNQTLKSHDLFPFTPNPSKNYTLEWIHYLLLQVPKIGKELLLKLEGHADFKVRWLLQFPELTMTLIGQVADDKAIQTSHVVKWLHSASAVAVYNTLINHDRWVQVCAYTRPDYFREALLPDVVQVFEREETLAPEFTRFVLERTCTPQTMAYAERVVAKLEKSPQLLTKSCRACLKGCLSKVCTAKNASFILSYMNQYGVHDSGLLLMAAGYPLTLESATWYLSLRKTEKLPLTFEPEKQLRVFMQIARNFPDAVSKADASYVQSLYDRLQEQVQVELRPLIDELDILPSAPKQKAVKPQPQQTEALESLIKKKEWNTLAERLLNADSASEQHVQRCVDGLLDENVTMTLVRLLAKYRVKNVKQWTRAFAKAFETFDFPIDKAVMQLRAMEPQEVLAAWDVVFARATRLSTKTMQTLVETQKLFAVIGTRPKVIEGIKEYLNRPIGEVGPCLFALRLYGYIPKNHSRKVFLGINLIAASTPETTKETKECASILLSIYEDCFGSSENPPKEYPSNYRRLLELVAASKDPDLCSRALTLDVHLENNFPNHVKEFKKQPHVEEQLHRVVIRLIQYEGFTGKVISGLEKFLVYALPTCMPFFCASSRRFYSFQYGHSNIRSGSIAPTREHVPQLRNILLYALEYAGDPQATEKQVCTLLDFGLQLLRNLIEKHPITKVDSDMIQEFATCVAKGNALFETHRTLVRPLLQKAIQKGILRPDSSALGACLDHLDIPVDDMQKVTTDTLRQIKESLKGVSDENVIELLITQQKRLLVWQDGVGREDLLTERLQVLNLIFSIWHQYVIDVGVNIEIIPLMKEILAPNAAPFGADCGEQGHIQALDANDLLFNFYKAILQPMQNGQDEHGQNEHGQDEPLTKDEGDYCSLTIKGAFLQANAAASVRLLQASILYNFFEGHYERFAKVARSLMELFHPQSCPIPIGFLSDSGAQFTRILITHKRGCPEHSEARMALIHDWLTVVAKNKNHRLYEPFLESVISTTVKEKGTMEFSEQILLTYYSCMRVGSKRAFIDTMHKSIQESNITAGILPDLCAIYQSLASENPSPEDAPKLAFKCLLVIINAFSKAAYGQDDAQFEKDANKIMLFFKKPVFVENCGIPIKGLLLQLTDALMRAVPTEIIDRIVATWTDILYSHNDHPDLLSNLGKKLGLLEVARLTKRISNDKNDKTK